MSSSLSLWTQEFRWSLRQTETSLWLCLFLLLAFHLCVPSPTCPPCLSLYLLYGVVCVCVWWCVPSSRPWRHACAGDGGESCQVSVLGAVPFHVAVPRLLHACLPRRPGLCARGLQWDRHASGQCWSPGCREPDVEPTASTAYCAGGGLSCGARGPGYGAWGNEPAADPSGLCGNVPPRWGQMGDKGESGSAIHGSHHSGER